MSNLSLNVLVLNNYYRPINVTTAKNAFIMLCKGSAEVVSINNNGSYDCYDFNSWAELSTLKRECGVQSEDDWVATVTLMLCVPRVIKTNITTNGFSKKILLTRKNIFWRDNSKCQYCGKKINSKELTIDHIIPMSKGGKTVWENVVSACKGCNSIKADYMLEKTNLKLIKKPTKPDYIPAFKLCTENTKYIIWKNFISDLYWNVELKD